MMQKKIISIAVEGACQIIGHEYRLRNERERIEAAQIEADKKKQDERKEDDRGT